MVLKSFRFHVFYFLVKIKALKTVLSRLKEGGQRRVEREMRAAGG